MGPDSSDFDDFWTGLYSFSRGFRIWPPNGPKGRKRGGREFIFLFFLPSFGSFSALWGHLEARFGFLAKNRQSGPKSRRNLGYLDPGHADFAIFNF